MAKSIDWKKINTYGPYSMAVWKNLDGVSIGNQESMDGRAELMHETLRKSIVSNFSFDELSNLTILDVGCHDGWLLSQLSNLPFKAMTGIEPRAKNVKKGEVVREELGISNNIEFLVGDLDSLNGRKFDIVVCTGVLYHVESIADFLKQLESICQRFLFIESRTIDSKLVTEELIRQSEIVDLPYKFDQLPVGLSMHKFESTFSDGSSHKDIVVSLPTPETLMMYLRSLNFENICIELSPTEFRNGLIRKDRPLDGICISAYPKKNTNSIMSDLKYESSRKLEAIYSSTLLPIAVLNEILVSKQHGRPLIPGRKKDVWKWLQPDNFRNKRLENSLISKFNLNQDQAIIFKDIKFNPFQKIDFEFAKIDFFNNKFELAIKKLIQLISTENGDWRVVYRSFFLLMQIGKFMDNEAMIIEYRDCLELCNPQHPYFTNKIL